jgi:peptidoglycan/xylan/chitin deacetylase (PgdA/CDA1 family)
MCFSKKIFLFVSILFFSDVAMAALKEVAITIDDLPLVGSTRGRESNLRREKERFLNILNALKEKNAPATGFVVAGSIEKGQWALLEQFRDAGFIVGNHTYSHIALGSNRATRYIDNIKRADEKLAPLMTKPKYFRYPYLSEGNGKKKQEVLDYLAANDYIVAPVTIDSKDFRFNQQLFRVAYRSRPAYIPHLKRRYLAYIWKQTLRAEKNAMKKFNRPIKHILLLHANLINSHVMGDIIDMYRQNGYTIISLPEALKDPAMKQVQLQQENWIA